MNKSVFAAIFSIIFFLNAPLMAGPQFIDESGFAASGYDVVAYWSLKQKAVGSAQPAAVPGKKTITTKFNGATWAFSSEENRDKFLKNPSKYVPAYDGHCAYGVAQGVKVPTNPNYWRIVDGKLYLNITKTVSGYWEKDIRSFIQTANKTWKGLNKENSPKQNAPEFDSNLAPK
jgi:YHS domain-containing protein